MAKGVADRDLVRHIRARASRVGLSVPDTLADPVASYIALLARWNRKINLTSLAVDPPSDEALDRLVVEPLLASRVLREGDRLVIDVGSGGGSPAIPMHLASGGRRLVLVEVKARKAAFLREAVRVLALERVEVENRSLLELLTRHDLHESADVVTARAVRVDTVFLKAARMLVNASGRVFWFASVGSTGLSERDLLSARFVDPLEVLPLLPALGSELRIFNRAK